MHHQFGFDAKLIFNFRAEKCIRISIAIECLSVSGNCVPAKVDGIFANEERKMFSLPCQNVNTLKFSKE